MITKPGLYLDMSAREYFADCCPQPSLTQSIAKILIDRSPAHARLAHPRLNPDFQEPFEYEKRLAIGNAAHKLLIGRGKEVCIIEADDFRKTDAKETRDRAIVDGYVPILAKHMKQAHELVKAARVQLDIADCEEAFFYGNGEVVVAWQEDDIWFRTMIDWAVPNNVFLYDLKTSGRSAAPQAVPFTMEDGGWPIQAAMQERGLDIVDPENAGRRVFRFVMVENTPPFALTINEMTEAAMTHGRKQLDYAIRIWRHCMKTNTWPAYPPHINYPEIPGFKEAQWLAREIAEEDARVSHRPRDGMLTDLSAG
jgi:hypothetical protein